MRSWVKEGQAYVFEGYMHLAPSLSKSLFRSTFIHRLDLAHELPVENCCVTYSNLRGRSSKIIQESILAKILANGFVRIQVDPGGESTDSRKDVFERIHRKL